MKNITKLHIRYPRKIKNDYIVITVWLEKRVAMDLEKARNECLRRYNDHLLITDAGRTYEQQEQLKKAKPKLAAKPGFSWHEAGMAIDVDMAHLNKLTGSQEASEKFLAEFGFKRTCWEPWHFENHKYYSRKQGVRGAIIYVGNDK